MDKLVQLAQRVLAAEQRRNDAEPRADATSQLAGQLDLFAAQLAADKARLGERLLPRSSSPIMRGTE